jgi:hypothetical protein
MADVKLIKPIPASGDATALQEMETGDTLGVVHGGTGSTTASGARANLGLGTAAVEDIGTSGDTVPKNNTANVYSQIQDFSAAGIYLGAAAASNLLDDYEIGTFNPTIQDDSLSDAEGQTYSVNAGDYIKIGDFVYGSAHIVVTSLGTLTTTQIIRIANFPFVPATTTTSYGSISIDYASSLSITAGTSLQGQMLSAITKGIIVAWDSATGVSIMPISNLTASGDIYFSFKYRAA